MFFIFYFVFYMTDASIGYFNIYLRSIHFSTFQMGLLTAGASLIAMLFQPYVGMLTDRSSSKNRVLLILLSISAMLAPLLLISKSFFYILVIYTAFQLSRNAQRPISDTITLEYIDQADADYGPIRVMGCLGYATMAAITGYIADWNIGATFFAFSSVALLSALVFLPVPRMSGHQSDRKSRVSPRLLLRDKTLILLVVFSVIFSMTKSFYHGYYAIYFTDEIGGSATNYGFLLSVGALFEIPFIFFSDRVVKRLGATRTLLLSGLLDTLRWALTFLCLSPGAQMAVQMVLGMNNMVMHVAMTITINSTVAPELKATGQTTFATVSSLCSMICGTLIGGALADLFGIRPLFAVMAAVDAAAVVLFAVLFRKMNLRSSTAIR